MVTYIQAKVCRRLGSVQLNYFLASIGHQITVACHNSGGFGQHIIFGKYIFPLSIARWLRQLIIYSTSASLIWRSLTNHLKFILHWIFWKPCSGLEILIGRDALSLDILEQLSFSNLHFLYQAKSPSRIPLLYSEPLLASSLSWLDHDSFVSIEC